MIKFLILSFVVSPVVRFVVSPSRELAMATMFAIVFYTSMKSEKNYFQHLKVTPHCSLDAIKKSFKAEAMLLHPDRNTSPTAASDYVELSQMYKTLVNDKKREAYVRYGDMLRGRKEQVVDMSPFDVLYVVTVNTASMLFGMCFTVLLHGQSVVNLTALLYEVFCFALDVYLRFAPDATSFLAGVPILKYYTVFEIIAFLRSFRLVFLYYHSLMGDDDEDKKWKAGICLVRNNMVTVDLLDEYIVAVQRYLTSRKPVVDSEIVWRGAPSVGNAFENRWNYSGNWHVYAH
ncbi:DNAJ/HSP40 domain containing protein, putative [Babesia bigemina]|uniref:DNAJ/HSP40 domain containing protein, putative n=1 Tax=Babesia bigemina TaxID=5866 RepID=A0A061DAD0_BABBI|nr:DNAJ/HSP40 domain containing protein, putative [Babesia bigemina]CDR96932.1 DNAJ/HSP40 domain containing protein, putative [Babesia bigemina]|eukprot:XP_012769118.1 DNAJ/HSP40 domain containing protein, putative [Babesia bigemina]